MGQIVSQVSSLLSFGADAMDNMFDVDIDFPPALKESMYDNITEKSGTEWPELSKSLNVRCQGFIPPAFTFKTYALPYKTLTILKPAGRIDGSRTIKLLFRLDAYYWIYRLLVAWRALAMQPSTGYAATRVTEDSYGTINVVALDSPIKENRGGGYGAEGVTVGLFTDFRPTRGLRWIFKDVWVSDIGNPVFKTGGGDGPQMIEATFVFGEYTDPQQYDDIKKTELRYEYK